MSSTLVSVDWGIVFSLFLRH